MRIHGKWYDMSGYNHPGGPIMLKLGEGRDATAMFEAHHPFTNRVFIEKLLRKHEINPEDPDCPPCELYDPRDKDDQHFEWPEAESNNPDAIPNMAPVSSFALELQMRVKEYFEGEAKRRGVPLIEAIKATPMRWAQLILLCSIFVATLPAFFAGEYWTLLATPLAYWIWGVNCFHDGSHFALSRDWRINAVGTYTGWWFSSPLVWYHQHVVGHHAYPNIPKRDPDLYHNNMMERHTKTLRHKSMHSHQQYTFIPIWMIGTFAMNYLKPVQMFMSGQYNRAVHMVKFSRERIARHVLGRFLVFAMCHLWSFVLLDSWLDAFLFSAVPVVFVSVFFMICSQVNHLSMENVDVSDRCYYAHQVVTSHSFGGTNWLFAQLAFLFTGGLNLQIEHHLFPTVNHCHLPALQKTVKTLCKKHNVFYHESSGIVEALTKYMHHMEVLSHP